MFSQRFAILGVLVALPALAQVPGQPVPTPGPDLSLVQHAPMRFHSLRPDGSVSSSNWSGYAVTGSEFTYAKGSWIVPSVNCGKTPNSYAAFWVGIDGYTSTTVEQTGTLTVCVGKTAAYYAWYEFFPAEAIQVIAGLTANPGNKISAEVTFAGGKFTVKITNETTGKSFSKTAAVSGAKRNSAEWIAEAPTVGGSVAPLSDFGTTSFGDDYTEISDTNWASDSTVTGPISDFGKDIDKIFMVSGSGVDEAVPSALTTDGSSFKVAWKSE
jgi:hypothetical protein